MHERACVYTALLGKYELLNEQPAAEGSNLPFICFTDNPELTSKTWQIRLIDPLLPADAVRSQRHIKINPHLYVPDFDRSLYIDNSIILDRQPEDILKEFDGPEELVAFHHSFRERLFDEFVAVIDDALDDPHRIYEQLNHIQLTEPDLLYKRPMWGAFLLRRQHQPAAIRFATIWSAHVMRYSRRDQLSFPIAQRLAGLSTHVIEEDNHKSWFHHWPVIHGRRSDMRQRHFHLRTDVPILSQVMIENNHRKQASGATDSKDGHKNLSLFARSANKVSRRIKRLRNSLSKRWRKVFG